MSLTRVLLLLLVFLLTACLGERNYAPLVERYERASVVPNSHRVKTGETLYSIAWRYGMDYRRLAAANNIESPFTIYPGQQILLKSQSPKSRQAGKQSPPSPSNEFAKGNSESPKSLRQTPTKLPNNTKRKASPTLIGDNPYRWQWPAPGQILRSYKTANALRGGIEIRGKLGEPVRAANSGRVVYAGNGLVGYGNLLIIKHDQTYLSAYGHNRKILVKEGEIVRVGQKIAEFGDSGTNDVKLHFEIRKHGQSVNPLSLLPSRRQ